MTSMNNAAPGIVKMAEPILATIVRAVPTNSSLQGA
jgi:hypothetical protein